MILDFLVPKLPIPPLNTSRHLPVLPPIIAMATDVDQFIDEVLSTVILQDSCLQFGQLLQVLGLQDTELLRVYLQLVLFYV